jgi:glycine cleavage system H protein
MSIPGDRLYTREHEWIQAESGAAAAPPGSVATVGITDFAQQSLGDIVFVELPKVGARVTAGESFGVVESVKSVSDLYSPATGVVEAVNEALHDSPELLNQDPYRAGWILRVRVEAVAEDLMDAAAYARQVRS